MGYVKLSINLQDINFPKNYKVLLHAGADYTDWLLIPPPKTNITFHPNPVEVAQGEEKTIEIQLKSNAAIDSQIQIFSNGTNGISTQFMSSIFQLSPGDVVSIPVSVKASGNARISPHTLTVFVDSNFLYQPPSNTSGLIPANVSVSNIQDSSQLSVIVTPWWQQISSFLAEFGLIIGLVVGGGVSQLWTLVFDKMKRKREVKKSSSLKATD